MTAERSDHPAPDAAEDLTDDLLDQVIGGTGVVDLIVHPEAGGVRPNTF